MKGLFARSLLATAMLTGCGGSSPHERPLSKSQFVARADAICARATNRMKPVQKPVDVSEIATFMAAALPVAEDEQRRLRALVPPVTDQKRYARLLDLFAQSIAKVPEIRTAAEASDEQRVQRLMNDLTALEQRENGANEELGLKQCVNNEETEG